jgi:preprotein translocase subunit SecG
MITFLTVVYVAVCIFLILVVLLQAGRGGGMGAAFGGASQTVFGASGAGNFLTRLTVVMAATFMLLSATLAYLSSSSEKSLQRAAAVAREREDVRAKKEAKEKAAREAEEAKKAAEAAAAAPPAAPTESAPIEATAVGAEEVAPAAAAEVPPVRFVGSDGKPIEGIKLERVEGKELDAFKAQRGAAPPGTEAAPAAPSPSAPAQ